MLLYAFIFSLVVQMVWGLVWLALQWLLLVAAARKPGLSGTVSLELRGGGLQSSPPACRPQYQSPEPQARLQGNWTRLPGGRAVAPALPLLLAQDLGSLTACLLEASSSPGITGSWPIGEEDPIKVAV